MAKRSALAASNLTEDCHRPCACQRTQRFAFNLGLNFEQTTNFAGHATKPFRVETVLPGEQLYASIWLVSLVTPHDLRPRARLSISLGQLIERKRVELADRCANTWLQAFRCCVSVLRCDTDGSVVLVPATKSNEQTLFPIGVLNDVAGAVEFKDMQEQITLLVDIEVSSAWHLFIR
jgi:hypothetical protein